MVLLLPAFAYTQTSVTFTNASATGRYGPTQSQINTAYSGTALANNVTINTQGIQEWTVPANGTYTIEVWGAAGTNDGDNAAGYGARMKGDFTLTQGTVLQILVGQMPQLSGYNGAGGGGTFVVKKTSGSYSDSQVLVIERPQSP